MFSFKQLHIYPHEEERTSFENHSFSENVMAPEIEPGTTESVARNCDNYTTLLLMFESLWCWNTFLDVIQACFPKKLMNLLRLLFMLGVELRSQIDYFNLYHTGHPF
jgi:hypothetical protein